MGVVFLALGLVFILERLVLALAPSRITQILALLASLPEETRRLLGLLAVTAGGILLTLGAILAG